MMPFQLSRRHHEVLGFLPRAILEARNQGNPHPTQQTDQRLPLDHQQSDEKRTIRRRVKSFIYDLQFSYENWGVAGLDELPGSVATSNREAGRPPGLPLC